MVEPKVLFEDEHLLVVDKPSGMVVNRGFGAGGLTMQDWLESNFQFSIFAPSPKRLWRVGDKAPRGEQKSKVESLIR